MGLFMTSSAGSISSQSNIDVCKAVMAEIQTSVATSHSIMPWSKPLFACYQSGFKVISALLQHDAELDYIRSACSVAFNHLNQKKNLVFADMFVKDIAIAMCGRGGSNAVSALALLKFAERNLYATQTIYSDARNFKDGKLVSEAFPTHTLNIVFGTKPLDFAAQFDQAILTDAVLSHVDVAGNSSSTDSLSLYLRHYKLFINASRDNNQRFIDDPKLIASTYEAARRICELAKRLMEQDEEFHKYKKSLEVDPKLSNEQQFIAYYKEQNSKGEALAKEKRLEARLKTLVGREAESKIREESKEDVVDFGGIKERLNKQFIVPEASWLAHKDTKLIWIQGQNEGALLKLAVHLNKNGMAVKVKPITTATGSAAFGIKFRNPPFNLLSAIPPLEVT